MTTDVTYLTVLEGARNEYAEGDSFLAEVFDNAIRQVKAEAWDLAMEDATMALAWDADEWPVNPYR